MSLKPALRLLTICVVGITLILPVYSQNLVVNGSFEDPALALTGDPEGWNKYFDYDTPDYFNFSENPSQNSLFGKYMGGTTPKEGDACMGIFCYRVSRTRKIKDVREFIESPLTAALVKDSLYNFRISLFLDAESNVVIRNFGVLFTETRGEIKSGSRLFRMSPAISFNTDWLDSTGTWMTLEGTYKANGNERYIILGNLLPDYKTYTLARKVTKETGKKEKWRLARQEQAAYYYLDDVSLEPISSGLMDPVVPEPESFFPEYNIAEITKDTAVVLRNVNFVFNSTEFIEGSYPELDRLLRFLEKNAGVRIKINGYADNIGSRGYNLRLSQKRSEAVREYLVLEGIASDRIECEGFGFEKPIRENDSEENRQLNRRVEFVVLAD